MDTRTKERIELIEQRQQAAEETLRELVQTQVMYYWLAKTLQEQQRWNGEY